MKISAIIDGNVVSGTVLLDDLNPLSIKLKHKFVDAGVTKYITLATVNFQPQIDFLDFSFLNPHYYTSLFIDINGELQQVMESTMEGEEEFEVENPLNDYVFTTNQIPEVTEVMVKDEVLDNDIQDFEGLSHLAAPNLVEMEDVSVNGHFTYNEGIIRFDVTDTLKTVGTEVFELGNASEITIAIDGTQPSECRLILINHRGEERVLNMSNPYQLFDRTCYSSAVVSSTKEARVELDYPRSFDGYRRVEIRNIYIGKTAQYFEADDMDTREVVKHNIAVHPITCFVFNFERLPPFGLRNLLNIVAGLDGLKVQFSNSKIRVVKVVDGSVAQTVMSTTVANDKTIGVVISDFDLKIYSDQEEIKSVAFNTPLSSGNYTAEIGAADTEPDLDCNAILNLTVSNKNSFE
jgi:hypothetical protein